MATALSTFLAAQASKIAAQIAITRAKLGKEDIPDAEQRAIEDILAAIEFGGWSVLAGDISPILEDIAADQGRAVLLRLGIDVEARSEVMNIVSADAIGYAEERAAEMVGMRFDELGRMVSNPNAAWRIDEGTREMIRADVTQAIEEGWSNQKLAAQLADSYAFSDERAMVIARTETAMATQAASVNAYKASGVVDGKQWLTAEDDKVSEDCAANGEAGPNGDGVLLDFDADYPSGDSAPPAHPNCLPGDALVTPCGGVSGCSERWYDGEVFVVRTASGNNLTCTPNHPVLTDRGWVPARALDVGRKVISALEWAPGAHHDGENVPARIQDVAKSARCSGEMLVREVPLSAEDFHGDGIGSEVAIVGTDRPLRDGLNAERRQRGGGLDLKITDMQAKALHGLRALDLLGKRMLATARCAMSVARLRAALFLRHALPLDALGLGLAAAGNAGGEQSTPDGLTTNAEPFGDLVFGRAGKVFAEDVIDIKRKRFHGRVYNIETESGYYVANGIVTHNCRCTLVPWFATDESQAAPAAQLEGVEA